MKWVETMARIGSHAAISAGCVLAVLAVVSSAPAASIVGDPTATCGGLAGAAPNAVQIDSATLQAASPLAVSARAPTPAARVTPANPPFCKVLGVPLLATREFSHAIDGQLASLGHHALRGVQQTQELFTLPQLAATATARQVRHP